MDNTDVRDTRSKARKDYDEKVIDLIVDMGDRFDEEQRRNAARSIVEDYDDLTTADAEDFLNKNRFLITNGKMV